MEKNMAVYEKAISVHAHETEKLEHAVHEFMSAIGVEVLIGAGAGDDGDAIGFAYVHRRGGDAGGAGGESGFRAHHAMHPDVFDPQVHALADDCIGHFGVGEHKDRIRFERQRG